MTRGTTPTIRITVKDIESLDNTDVYVTIKQGCVNLTIEGDALTIDENVIEFTLTQEQTLMFRQGPAKIQVRGRHGETAWASQVVTANSINPILRDGVI